MFATRAELDEIHEMIAILKKQQIDTTFELARAVSVIDEGRKVIKELHDYSQSHAKEWNEYKDQMKSMNSTLKDICGNVQKMADTTEFVNKQRDAFSTLRSNLIWISSVFTAASAIAAGLIVFYHLIDISTLMP